MARKRQVHNVWKFTNPLGETFVFASVGSGALKTFVTIGLAGISAAEKFLRSFEAGVPLDEDDVKKAQREAAAELREHYPHGTGPKEWKPGRPRLGNPGDGSGDLPYKDVKESAFDVELEFEVPWDFWEEKPEPPYEHPGQLRLFKLEPLFRADWLEQFHHELRKRGWPAENITAIYSYFNDPVENPRTGEEEDDPHLLPLMRFRVWIPGDWLVEHPDFFTSFDKLAKEGVGIKTNGDEGPYGLVYWRIYADQGPLKGTDWGDSGYFTVKAPRERPAAMREEGPKEWFPELSGAGYDESKPSMRPFEWVEHYRRIGDLAVLAYGAYNAFGLIGPEKGGVAVVLEEPEKAVIATKDFPYDPKGRAEEFKRIVGLLSSPKEWSPRGPTALRARIPHLAKSLEAMGYGVRIR